VSEAKDVKKSNLDKVPYLIRNLFPKIKIGYDLSKSPKLAVCMYLMFNSLQLTLWHKKLGIWKVHSNKNVIYLTIRSWIKERVQWVTI